MAFVDIDKRSTALCKCVCNPQRRPFPCSERMDTRKTPPNRYKKLSQRPNHRSYTCLPECQYMRLPLLLINVLVIAMKIIVG